jgi:aminopeptidase N
MMKSATALAAVLAAALLVPAPGTASRAMAAEKHATHKGGAHKPAAHKGAAHAGAAHKAAGAAHKGAAHGKAAHGKAAGTKGKHGKPQKVAKAPPPPPPPKPQILTPPSRADRTILPAYASPTHYDITLVPDMAKHTFAGRVRIDVTVKTATRQLKLNAADMTFEQVRLAGTSGAPQTPKWSLDPKAETATLTFAQPLKPGRYTLSISYSGRIASQAAGLFHLDYKAGDATKSALFTQFESADARRVFPGWDEPARKATFTLTADVPADLMAVSNMPELSSEALPSGLKRVHFRQTPEMSSYLLFFGLGDFERVTRQVGDTELGMVVKRGETGRARYALDAAAELLGYYNTYFGTPYPLPKMDMIAGPGSSQFFGAMENWGALFYFESAILIDPELSTQTDRQRVYSVVAHEMAHQWFGDLVTMEWWDDLWLNEGFASWMATKATSHFHPEWRLELKAQASRNGAMGIDAREGSHPIVQHVKDVREASEAFDAISYQKGAAVISMLETDVGPDTFREGIRRYVSEHARGSAVTEDLWKAMDAVSPQKITNLAHDFTLQPGVPLITVTAEGQGATLNQTRFGLDDASRGKLRWEVPVTTARAYGAGSWRGLVSTVEPASLKPPIDGLVVNAGQSAYFRTRYVGPMFTRIADAWPRLTPADQLGLLNDTAALSLNGDQPMADLLGLLDRAGTDLDPVVAETLVGKFRQLGALERGAPGATAFKAFAVRRLTPLLARVEADPRVATDPSMIQLRSALIETLARFDDPAMIDAARARYAAWKADPTALRADERRTTLEIVAAHADAATWDELKARAQSALTALEKQQFLELLGLAQDVRLARQALDLTFAADTPATEGLNIVRTVAELHPDLALDHALAHPAEVNARLDTNTRGQFIPGLAALSAELDAIEKLDAYVAANPSLVTPRTLSATRSAIRLARRLREQRLPEIDRWLATHPN